jgi:PHD/YefM family antitoxin component YafN of YafNO toxin-antitoxin module
MASTGRKTAQPILDPQFVVDQDGKRQAVIVPLKQYERLMEDLHDLAAVAERRDEEPISLNDMKRRLREDGLL